MVITTIAKLSLFTGALCSLIIIIDLINHGQKMWIMNIVWPVTALYAGFIGLWAYYKLGKMLPGKDPMHHSGQHHSLSWKGVVKGTLHCGAGCTIGDIAAQSFLAAIPLSLVSDKLYNDWIVEYFFALIVGIIFQYYAIKPMKHLSPAQAIPAAFKADVLSLTCWQIGMYGWMAIAELAIFQHSLKASNPVFWLMMQIGMLAGFVTAFPVNRWLMKKGTKESM